LEFSTGDNLFTSNFKFSGMLFKKIKNNQYFYFFFKLLLLGFIVFVLDFSIGSILRYYYFKQEVGRDARATYAIEKTYADILIFGSSRAYHQYIPTIFEEKTKQSCYNTGSPGVFLLHSYAVLKAVLKRYTPKLIVLDINSGDLGVERESYDALSFLMPYYAHHKEIRPIVDLKDAFERIKNTSSIYPFNSQIFMIAGGNLEYFKKRNIDIKGYKPLNRIWNESIKTRDSNPYPLDTTKVDILKYFIRDCKRAGIKLVIVFSPMYFNYTKTEYSVTIAKQIANEEHICFFDFTNDTFFIKHPVLFDDPTHLNNDGAMLFTNKIVDSISRCVH